MTPDERRRFELRRDARRAALSRMTKRRLIGMCRAGIEKPDGGRAVIEGGMYPLAQWSKDDLIASVMSVEFPPEARDEHQDDEPGPAVRIPAQWVPLFDTRPESIAEFMRAHPPPPPDGPAPC